MGQQGQGHRFPASIKAGVAASRWAKHGHWYQGLQVLTGDWICPEPLLKSSFPAFSVPTCPGTSPYAFYLGTQTTLTQACLLQRPGRPEALPALPLCCLSLWPQYPLIGMFCVWGSVISATHVNTSPGDLRGSYFGFAVTDGPCSSC